MDTEKITEARALAEEARVAPAPVAADLLAEARTLAAEGRNSPDPETSDMDIAEMEPQDPLDTSSALAEEAPESTTDAPLPEHALLPTGGILEMGQVLDLLRAPLPAADTATEAAPETDHSTAPSPDHPVYGAVYGRRH